MAKWSVEENILIQHMDALVNTVSIWYHDPPTTLPTMVKMKKVIHANLTFNCITSMTLLTLLFGGYKDMSPLLFIQSHHDLMPQEISRREILEYT